MLSKAITLLGMLFIIESALPQSCNLILSGTIIDENGDALLGASVILDSDTVHGIATNSDGYFVFKKLCPRNYSISIRFVGYRSTIINFDLSKSSDIQVKLEQETAQLKEITIEDQPGASIDFLSYNKISSLQLKEVAGKTLGETLQGVSGVGAIQTGPGIFKPVIHGVHSQRILILNYGIRQEGQQWGAEHAPEIDPFIASEIIVIKDASAIKYGGDALGGVVIVNPPSLPNSSRLGGSVNTIFQSNGKSTIISGMLEGGILHHEGWGWRIQGTGKRAGDFHAPRYSLTNTGLRETNFTGSIGYHHEQRGIELYFSHFQTSLGILKGTAINNLNDLNEAMDRNEPFNTTSFGYAIEEPRQEVSHNLLKLNGHWKTNTGDWRLEYSFQNNNRKEYDIRYGNLSNKPAMDLLLNTHSVDAELELTPTPNRNACLGISTTIQNNKNQPGTGRIPFIPNFASYSAGVYSIFNFQINTWQVNLGARYDFRGYDVAGYDFKNSLYRADYNYHNASFTVGTSWSITEDESLAINLSSAWRPPHVSELYSLGTHQGAAANEYGLLLNDSTNEILDIRQSHIENEQALKWITSYKLIRNKIQIDASGYINYILNYTYLRPDGVTQTLRGTLPAFRYTQTNALFFGWDFSSKFQLTRQLNVSPKFSWLYGRDVYHHDHLVFITPNQYEITFRLDNLKKFLFPKFYLESHILYTDRQHNAPRVIEPYKFNSEIYPGDPLNGSNKNFDFMAPPDGYWLIKFNAGFSIVRPKIHYDFRASVENILNTSYRAYTNRYRYYADEIGRNISISFSLTF